MHKRPQSRHREGARLQAEGRSKRQGDASSRPSWSRVCGDTLGRGGRVWGHVWAWGHAWGRANVCCLHVSARGREAVSPGGGNVKEWGSWQTGTPRSQAYVTILTLFCWLSFPHRVHPALQIVTLTSL